MKMPTLMDPRAQEFEKIYQGLTDRRFADEAINLALDARDRLNELALLSNRSPFVAIEDMRAWLRAQFPEKYAALRNVKLAISILIELTARPVSVTVLRRPVSIRQ